MADASVAAEPAQNIPGSNFLRGATNMPIVRQITLLVALTGSIAFGVFAMFWIQEKEFRPLGNPESHADTARIVDTLEQRQIEFRLNQQTGMILVAADRIYDARMALAEEGVLPGTQKGYDLLDEDPGFGVSQFREFNIHRRSVEGELARSVMAIESVLQARVILATPKTTAFLRDRRRPSASVHVSLRPNRSLSTEQVRGIMNLVAAGVAELTPEEVVVVDQSGALLSSAVAEDALQLGERELDYTRSLELSLHDKVANILTPWVGVNRFTAEVSAEVDFTRSEQTQEIYNPEKNSLRSEQRSEEQRVGAENQVGGVPGTLSNRPPEFGEATDEAEAEEAGEARSSSISSTRNFEIDRTINHIQQQTGKIQRLNVSVVVDHIPGVDAETGEPTFTPWTEEDLQLMSAAVRSAIGFREDRGDSVSVVNRAFFRPEASQLASPSFWEQAWFADLIKQVLGGLALIAVIFGLLRPLFKNLSQAGELVREQQSLAIADMSQLREAAMQEAVPGLPSPLSVESTNDGVMKMETVRNLVNDDPDRVAQVVKNWVSDGE